MATEQFFLPSEEEFEDLAKSQKMEEDEVLDDFLGNINKRFEYKAMSTIDEMKKFEIKHLREATSYYSHSSKRSKRTKKDGEESRCVIIHTKDFFTYLPKFYSDKHSNEIIKILNKKISSEEIKYFFKIVNKTDGFINLQFDSEKL